VRRALNRPKTAVAGPPGQEDADEVFVLTVWFPVTAATVEMGCLELMPGVHADGLVCRNLYTYLNIWLRIFIDILCP
jgi:hypothetical protein